MHILIKFICFGLLGITGIVIASAIQKSISRKRLILDGDVNLILFIVLGFAGILYPIIGIHTGALPWYIRGIVYMLIIFAFQFLAGKLLQSFDLCPWKYRGNGSISGLIQLSDAPIWFIFGMTIEWIYPYIKHIADALTTS